MVSIRARGFETAGPEAVLAVFVIVFGNVLVMAVYASRYKRVPPNKAMVVYGRRQRANGQTFIVITGGGKFIVPIVEEYEFLSLESFPFSVDLESVIADVRDAEPPIVGVHIEGLARVSSEYELIRVAAAQLLHKAPEEIARIMKATAEGHTRAAFATHKWGTPDFEIEAEVEPLVRKDLQNLGVELVGNLRIRRTDPVKDSPGISAQRLLGSVEYLGRRVRRIEEHLGITREQDGSLGPG